MKNIDKLVKILAELNKVLPEWSEAQSVETIDERVFITFTDDSAKSNIEKAFTFAEDELLRVERNETMLLILNLNRGN